MALIQTLEKITIEQSVIHPGSPTYIFEVVHTQRPRPLNYMGKRVKRVRIK